MSIFTPFRAFRPKPSLVKNIVSKPYDVLSREEAKIAIQNNRSSFYHVIKPEIDLPDHISPFSEEVYRKGIENFNFFVEQGHFTKDEKPGFYIYELTMGSHQQTGLVGCCSIDDYFEDNIKKHELTKPDIEKDRKTHILTSQKQYEAVFLIYPEVEEIDALIISEKSKPCIYNFATNGVTHRLWVVNAPAMTHQISKLFEDKVPVLYIADGHHRTAAGALSGRELRERSSGNSQDKKRYNYVLSAVFPSNQVQILSYNRLVKDLGGLSQKDFLEQVKKYFDVEIRQNPYQPEHAGCFGMYLAGLWYKLLVKNPDKEAIDIISTMDVTILSDKILAPILGIHDLRRDKRIEFVGGIRGLRELQFRVDRGDAALAFVLFPIRVEEIRKIADHNLLMPPKVTWFEPKLGSGLFVHDLQDEQES